MLYTRDQYEEEYPREPERGHDPRFGVPEIVCGNPAGAVLDWGFDGVQFDEF